MKVVIDAHMIGEQETGNETYILNLIRALRTLDEKPELVVAVAHPNEAEARLGGFDSVCRPLKVSAAPWARLGWQLALACRKEKADLLHVTYAGPLVAPCPMISTIHDVAYLAEPSWFSPRDRLVLTAGVGATVKRCARIITVSEHAKKEIVKNLGLPPERVAVTLEAAAPHYRRLERSALDKSTTLARFRISKPYILAVGNLQPRKNLARLVEAFARTTRKSDEPCQLVLAGKAQWRESEVLDCISRAGIGQRVVFTGYVSDEDLVTLFNEALTFAYPSLYEGFGLPVIEAMACGTPVLTSRVTSLPEVAGEAALLVDPLSIDSISDGLTRLLTDPGLRSSLSEKGMARAATFSWKACAAATATVYREVLSA